MTRLTTTLLITVSLISQIAMAGLPPTSTKSQLDTSKSTTFDFQAPFNQITKPSGTTGLIETGNKNLLKDPGFESSDPTAIWTLSSAGVFTRTGTAANVGSGSYAASYDGAAAGGMVASTAITIPNGWGGKNLEISCDIKNASAGTHTIQLYDGSNVLQSATILTGSGYLANVMNYPAPSSGTVQLRIVSTAANEPEIFFDDCYLGIARNVGGTQLISEWTSYTPTTAGLGTVTSVDFKWRRVGDSMEIQGRLAAGTATAVAATISIPSPYVVSSTKLSTGGEIVGGIVVQSTVAAVDWYIIGTGGSSNLNIGIKTSTTTGGFAYSNGNAIVNAATDVISVQASVPIAGWTAQTTASIDAISKRGSIYFASGSATNTGSVAAFNVAGFGTNTLEGQALAPTTANDLGIRMTGAPAATYEVQATGRFYASSAATTGTRTVCNYSLYDGTSTRGDSYAIATGAGSNETNDGVGTLTGQFVLSSAGTINVVVRGQRVTGNGTCYAEGPVSISIKNVSQQSPAIVLANSVSTDTTNGERIGRARIASGCAAVTSQSNDWISSVSSPGTGQCTINFTTGKFSSAPICVCSTVGQRTCRLNAASTTSALTVDMYDGSNPPVLVNTALDIICMGPR